MEIMVSLLMLLLKLLELLLLLKPLLLLRPHEHVLVLLSLLPLPLTRHQGGRHGKRGRHWWGTWVGLDGYSEVESRWGAGGLIYRRVVRRRRRVGGVSGGQARAGARIKLIHNPHRAGSDSAIGLSTLHRARFERRGRGGS
jgi:hypothetical protein